MVVFVCSPPPEKKIKKLGFHPLQHCFVVFFTLSWFFILFICSTFSLRVGDSSISLSKQLEITHIYYPFLILNYFYLRTTLFLFKKKLQAKYAVNKDTQLCKEKNISWRHIRCFLVEFWFALISGLRPSRSTRSASAVGDYNYCRSNNLKIIPQANVWVNGICPKACVQSSSLWGGGGGLTRGIPEEWRKIVMKISKQRERTELVQHSATRWVRGGGAHRISSAAIVELWFGYISHLLHCRADARGGRKGMGTLSGKNNYDLSFTSLCFSLLND
jgi:hypothetical protein